MKFVILTATMFLTLSSYAGQLDQVSFLSGCWGTTDEEGNKITEDWMRNSNNKMFGVSRTITSTNETVNNEFLTISWNKEDQKIKYQAILDGQQMAPFTFDQKLSSMTDKTAAFTNFKNDFPKIISYRKVANKLTVKLEGTDENGEHLEVVYDLLKESCGSRF